jgi:hypothetical protein
MMRATWLLRRVNYALNTVVAEVVGGLFLGKFLGDYGLVVFQRVFGDRAGPTIQPGADEPFLAGITFALLLLMFGAACERGTRRFTQAVEEAIDEDG